MRCKTCHYSLLNLPEHRCPECGNAFDPNDPSTFETDRSPLKVYVLHPRGAEEFEILRRMSVDPPHAAQVLSPERLKDLQRAADGVFIHNHVADYIVRLVMSTRSPVEFGMHELEGVIEIGASPRATLGLAAGARAVALIHGRNYVLPQDVTDLVADVFRHRLVLSYEALSEGLTADDLIGRIMQVIRAPEKPMEAHVQVQP